MTSVSFLSSQWTGAQAPSLGIVPAGSTTPTLGALSYSESGERLHVHLATQLQNFLLWEAKEKRVDSVQ